MSRIPSTVLLILTIFSGFSAWTSGHICSESGFYCLNCTDVKICVGDIPMGETFTCPEGYTCNMDSQFECTNGPCHSPTTTTEAPPFVCTSKGKFPDTQNPNKYHICLIDSSEPVIFKDLQFNCPVGSYFHPEMKICTLWPTTPDISINSTKATAKATTLVNSTTASMSTNAITDLPITTTSPERATFSSTTVKNTIDVSTDLTENVTFTDIPKTSPVADKPTIHTTSDTAENTTFSGDLRTSPVTDVLVTNTISDTLANTSSSDGSRVSSNADTSTTHVPEKKTSTDMFSSYPETDIPATLTADIQPNTTTSESRSTTSSTETTVNHITTSNPESQTSTDMFSTFPGTDIPANFTADIQPNTPTTDTLATNVTNISENTTSTDTPMMSNTTGTISSYIHRTSPVADIHGSNTASGFLENTSAIPAISTNTNAPAINTTMEIPANSSSSYNLRTSTTINTSTTMDFVVAAASTERPTKETTSHPTTSTKKHHKTTHMTSTSKHHKHKTTTPSPEFSCHAPGFYPDPSDCSKFYYCEFDDEEFEPHKLKCPSKKYFSAKRNRCVQKEDSECYYDNTNKPCESSESSEED